MVRPSCHNLNANACKTVAHFESLECDCKSSDADFAVNF